MSQPTHPSTTPASHHPSIHPPQEVPPEVPAALAGGEQEEALLGVVPKVPRARVREPAGELALGALGGHLRFESLSVCLYVCVCVDRKGGGVANQSERL